MRQVVAVFALAALSTVAACGEEESLQSRWGGDVSVGGSAASGPEAPNLQGGPFIDALIWHRVLSFLQVEGGMAMMHGPIQVPLTLRQPADAPDVSRWGMILPLGAKGVLPLLEGRIELRAGGGVAYLRYFEGKDTGRGYVQECNSCPSRGGRGWYWAGQLSVFPWRDAPLGFGAMVRKTKASTSGPDLITGIH